MPSFRSVDFLCYFFILKQKRTKQNKSLIIAGVGNTLTNSQTSQQKCVAFIRTSKYKNKKKNFSCYFYFEEEYLIVVGKSIWILVITIIMYHGYDRRLDCKIKKSTVQGFVFVSQSSFLFFFVFSLTKLHLYGKMRHFVFKRRGQAAESLDLPNQSFNQSIVQSVTLLTNQLFNQLSRHPVRYFTTKSASGN